MSYSLIIERQIMYVFYYSEGKKGDWLVIRLKSNNGEETIV